MQPIEFTHAWDDQKDLDALCAERPLQTSEILVQNAFYGSDRVLKGYAGLPDHYAIKIVVPHGLNYSGDLSYLARLERLPIVAYSCGDGDRLYRAAGIRNALWPLAAPYAYAVELARLTAPPSVPRRGTIFFPGHSIPDKLVEHDVDATVRRLNALSAEFKPITVCVYFLDYLRGLGRAFEQRGFRVVSAGHSHDPQFMIRLHHLITAHEFASSDDIGSCCYYSIYSGCRYRHLERESDRHNGQINPRATMFLDQLRRLSEAERDEQQSAANWMIGSDKLLSREELHGQLLTAECIDRWGLHRVRSGRRIWLRIERPWRPWLLRRWLLAKIGALD